MANKIKTRFKQYTEDNLRVKKLKTEARHNAKIKLEGATANMQWEEIDYESTQSSSHNR